ncbi:hypothetical protein HDU96_010215 [Phlyctochytrium bullatum]|nr:hypothetical protein HDU96_010215 [Phlyctochytrium bullatum]
MMEPSGLYSGADRRTGGTVKPPASPDPAPPLPPPAPPVVEVKVEGARADVPPLPRAPEAEDCCMGGCAHCVWDLYEEEVERYNEKMKELGLPGITSDRMDPSLKALRDMEKAMKG